MIKPCICTVEGCNNKGFTTKYCSKHYTQIKRHGKLFKITCQDFNEIVDKGDYYELVITNKEMIELGRAKIDKEDLEKVQKCGRVGFKADGYVGCGKSYLHRVVMGAKPTQEVDHKRVGRKYKLDNRKSKLRICTRSQNGSNRKTQCNNTSGVKGVHWSNKEKRWIASIKIDNKSHRLGSSKEIEKAASLYKKAAIKYHGEFYNAQ